MVQCVCRRGKRTISKIHIKWPALPLQWKDHYQRGESLPSVVYYRMPKSPRFVAPKFQSCLVVLFHNLLIDLSV